MRSRGGWQALNALEAERAAQKAAEAEARAAAETAKAERAAAKAAADVAKAEQAMELFIAPVLPMDVLEHVERIEITAKNYPIPGSNETANTKMVLMVSGVMSYNTTYLVFASRHGDIHIKNNEVDLHPVYTSKI